MDEFVKALKKLGFSSYDAKAFQALVKYHGLTAAEISQYSGVPRPKIYETVDRLEGRGLIDVVPQPGGRGNFYAVKPKSVLKKAVAEAVGEIEEAGRFVENAIDEAYDTMERRDVPIIGTAGAQRVGEFFLDAVASTREHFFALFPFSYYTEAVLEELRAIPADARVELVFLEKAELRDIQARCPRADFFLLETPAFELVRSVVQNAGKMLPAEQVESFTFKVFSEMARDLHVKFGLAVTDARRSLVVIPFPIATPVAIYSSLGEIVSFHLSGSRAILASSKRFPHP
ncbi:MAG: hypothetical protein Kow0069_08810 [Promethearchaeota archaeon]